MKHAFWKMILALGLLVASLPVLSADNNLDLPIGDSTRASQEVHVTLDGILDTRAGELITPADLVKRLGDTQVLFIGEEHTTPEFHAVQLAVIKALHDSGREVLIGLEMFPYTHQKRLDEWVAGQLTEDGFVELGNWYGNWSHHWGYYRDIFNYARDKHIPMYGVNLPWDSVTLVRKKGFDALDADIRAHLPPKIDLTNKQHRRLFRSYFGDDDQLHTRLSDDQLEGLYRAQVAWDAAMGWNAAQALQEHGGDDAIMVVMIGAGHVAYNLGAVRQLRANYDGEVHSLIPVAVRSDGEPTGPVRASYADYLWGVPGRDGPGLPVLGVSLAGRIGDQPTKVIQVSDSSTAQQAGVEVGDVIVSLGDEPVHSTADLQRITGNYVWGDAATLAIKRDGKPMTLKFAFRRPTPE